MIYIYNRDEIQIDHIDVEPIITEEIGKMRTLEFECDKEYEKGFRVVTEIEDKPYEFIIIDSEYVRDNVVTHTYYCQDSIIELQTMPIIDKRPNGNVGDALASILEGTSWTYEVINETAAKKNSFYHISVLEAFSEIMESYRTEWRTEYKWIGSVISERRIVVYVRDGISKGRLEFGKNIINFKRTVLSEPIITALYAYGKGEQLENGEYGRRISIEDVNNGIPYVENVEATEKYGIGYPGDKRALFGFLTLDDIEDKEELLKLAKEELEVVSQPRAEYEVEAIDFDIEAKIGYEVPVIDDEIGYRANARIIKIVRQGEDVTLTFGTVTKKFVDKFESAVRRTEKGLEDVYIQLNYIRTGADGKINVFSGAATPVGANQNDIWYRQNADGTVDTLRFNNGEWEEILSDRVFEELRAKIEENERIIAEAEERVNLKHGEIDGKQKELSDSILAFEEELGNVENSISTRLTSVEGNYSQLSQLVSGIQSEVSNEIDGIKSTQTQLSNLISTKVSSSDVSTIINQSYDSIYLGVQDKVISEIDKNQMTGNEIKTAINLSTDGVDISGKFISITGETSISNGVIKNAHIGDAQITDAKIGSVSADKITAGTIDARTVNLTYLNASNMTTGTLTGTQGSWNLNSGLFRNGSTSNFETRLQYGTMTQYEGGVERLRMNPQGLQFFSKVGTGQHIGMMMSAEYKSTGKHGLTIGHSYPDNAPAFINIGYLNTTEFNNTGNRTYEPYILFDKWNSISDIGTAGYPIKVIERAEFRSATLFDTSIDVNDYIKTGAWRWSAVTGLASEIGGAGFKIVDGLGYGFGFGANGTIWKVSAHSWTTKII